LAHEFKLDNLGFAILRVYIKPKDSPSMLPAEFKVDTGANCTTVGNEFLNELGYDEEWIKAGKLLQSNERPTVASGTPLDDCYKVLLPEIRIGDWVGYNWPVITSPNFQFKFLLGTDSMQFFNWNFDYARNLCTFNLIPGKRKLLFNQAEQSIHAIDDTA
jgi:hypothetical protein